MKKIWKFLLASCLSIMSLLTTSRIEQVTAKEAKTKSVELFHATEGSLKGEAYATLDTETEEFVFRRTAEGETIPEYPDTVKVYTGFETEEYSKTANVPESVNRTV
jgi:histidinol phosphatase-like PHP family hydrolase